MQKTIVYLHLNARKLIELAVANLAVVQSEKRGLSSALRYLGKLSIFRIVLGVQIVQKEVPNRHFTKACYKVC